MPLCIRCEREQRLLSDILLPALLDGYPPRYLSAGLCDNPSIAKTGRGRMCAFIMLEGGDAHCVEDTHAVHPIERFVCTAKIDKPQSFPQRKMSSMFCYVVLPKMSN